jgi:hypothetical protein
MSAVEISALARQVATDAAAASLRTMSEAIGEVVAGERAARRKELEEALAAERQRTSTEIAELHRQLAALKRKVAALQKQVVDVDKPKPLRLASG